MGLTSFLQSFDLFSHDPQLLQFGKQSKRKRFSSKHSQSWLGGLITILAILTIAFYLQVTILSIVNGSRNTTQSNTLGFNSNRVTRGNEITKEPMSWNDMQIQPKVSLADKMQSFWLQDTAFLNTTLEF